MVSQFRENLKKLKECHEADDRRWEEFYKRWFTDRGFRVMYPDDGGIYVRGANGSAVKVKKDGSHEVVFENKKT